MFTKTAGSPLPDSAGQIKPNFDYDNQSVELGIAMQCATIQHSSAQLDIQLLSMYTRTDTQERGDMVSSVNQCAVHRVQVLPIFRDVVV